MIAEIPNCLISLFSFVGFILVMAPFPWYWKGMTFYQLPETTA
jgi:pheromone a factor receptor